MLLLPWCPARTSSPDRIIGLGSADDADDVTGLLGLDLISLIEEVGVRDGELLAGDSEQPLFSALSSSSAVVTSSVVILSEVVGDFADSEETFEDRDERAFPLSSRCGFEPESVTLISTEPERDLEPRRSADGFACPLESDLYPL